MRYWYTFGAFGDKVIELSPLDIVRLLMGRDLNVRGTGIVISLGKSKCKSLFEAPSREQQLGLKP